MKLIKNDIEIILWWSNKKSKEDVKHIFFLVDVLKMILSFIEFDDILLDIILTLALYRNQCLAFLFSKALTVLHWDYICWFEAGGNEFVHYVFAVG